MPSYTVRLEKREPAKFKPTKDEAAEMLAAGIRFAEYNEAQGQFRISIPYRTAENIDRGTLTIMQGDA